mgnify:CR=1 FL=1
MKHVTFADIEGEIKKIPVDKLPEVFIIIKDYTQKLANNTDETSPGKRNMADALQELNGCIQIEDLNDYAGMKNFNKHTVTDYASTIDQELSITHRNEPSHDEE